MMKLYRTDRSFFSKTFLIAPFVIFLAGCGLQQPLANLDAPVTQSMGSFVGKAMGGNTPIGHANVTLYETQTGSSITNGIYTNAAKSLGTTTTDAGTGAFTFGSVTACDTGAIVYVTIATGDTGGGNNPNILLGSVLGYCNLVAPFAVVNEATTVAMAYAFSSFTSIDGSGNVNISASATNAHAATNSVSSGTVSTASGLQHAYSNFLNLVDVPSGSALAAPVSNSAAIAPQAVVNTLASDLQVCVNSTGGAATDTTNCGKLFALATPFGGSTTYPTNTFQAALNVARNPAGSVTGLFNLVTGIGASAVYSPTLVSAPNDWTLAIQYPVPANPLSGTAAFPFTLALDADDNVFVTSPEDDPWAINLAGTTNNTSDSISACVYGWTSNGAFRPSISPYTGTGGTVGSAGTGSAGHSDWFCSSSAATTTQTDYLLTSIAPDNVGNVWLANYGAPNGVTGLNHIIKLSNTGSFVAEEVAPLLSGQTTYYRVNNLVTDKLNNVIYSLQSASNGPTIGGVSGSSTGTTLNSFTLSSTNAVPQPPSAIRGLAVDSIGDIFGAGFGAQGTPSGGTINVGGNLTVVPIETGGQTTASTGNYNFSTTSRIATAVAGGTTGNVATNNAPFGVAIDSSNNAWVTAGGVPGQTATAKLGLFKCTETYTGGFIATQSCPSSSATSATPATAPKFLQADGNNVLWIADTTGILAYASTASPVTGTISETGGFKPCIVGAGTTCTYPDFNVSIKGVVVDSTGSVWFTTPDLTHTATNANALVQIIGSASATWPLLATQKPGVMP